MENMTITDKQVKIILRRLAVTSEQPNNGIAIIDSRGNIRFVNLFWRTMHGFNATDEIIGKHISTFHTKEQMESDIMPLMEETKQRGQLSGLVKHVQNDGVVFGTETKMISIKNAQNNVMGFVIFATATNRKLQITTTRQNQTKNALENLELRIVQQIERLPSYVTGKIAQN